VEDRRVAAAAVLARVRARVMTAWATPSPSSNRAMELRLVMAPQAWWCRGRTANRRP
jgi:hypothetical protein